MIIDAHHHLWDPAARRHAWLDGRPALRRRFGPDDYREAAAPAGVTASVLVQVLADVGETEEFLALAAASHAPGRDQVPVAGVVGWVDLCGPDVATEIARIHQQAGGDCLSAVRHLVQDEPDPEWLDRPEVRRGLRAVGAAGLAYDLLIRPAQRPAAQRVTAELDQVRFVLDHAAKPPIADGALEPWAAMMGELAARPNVVCKLSGLVTEAGTGWRPEQFAPYADVLLASFGPGRLMFGSDWPVCLLAGNYESVLGLARELVSPHMTSGELEAFFAGTARSVYQLAVT
ncbi:MAG TPA: amidohydrolase family protein [Streptosporangiaceae bacterium]|nr:amidohydrolase family protein [Streptosporangiaceae bacterium]